MKFVMTGTLCMFLTCSFCMNLSLIVSMINSKSDPMFYMSMFLIPLMLYLHGVGAVGINMLYRSFK